MKMSAMNETTQTPVTAMAIALIRRLSTTAHRPTTEPGDEQADKKPADRPEKATGQMVDSCARHFLIRLMYSLTSVMKVRRG